VVTELLTLRFVPPMFAKLKSARFDVEVPRVLEATSTTVASNMITIWGSGPAGTVYGVGNATFQRLVASFTFRLKPTGRGPPLKVAVTVPATRSFSASRLSVMLAL